LHADHHLLVHYSWLACCGFLLLLSLCSLSLLESKKGFAEEPTAEQTVTTFLSTDSHVSESPSEILTTTPISNMPTERIGVYDPEDARNSKYGVGSFPLIENLDKKTEFLINPNSNNYAIFWSSYLLNTTVGTDKIEPHVSNESSFVRWIDPKEKAATSFIPEGWSADLEIIRPYKSMTGFVFFARGDENTLVYAFQPFMPLYIIPSESLCETYGICFTSIITADNVREVSLGNAPMIVSNFKEPDQYFINEVLPLLTRNLDAYTVVSSESVYTPDSGNSTDLMSAYKLDYNFNLKNEKISGKAMVFTRNYTASDIGIWNGFIIGIESSENDFERVFQQAVVTLLNLKFEEEWVTSEKTVLLENANTSQALGPIPELMANSTLDDFYLIVPTAAHQLVTSYNNTAVADYFNKDNGEKLHLPLFPEWQHWYLIDDQLVGQDLRNLMNHSSLEPLF
jgi:hypothetical protein